MTLDGKLLRGLFEHEWLKPAIIRTNQGNVTTLACLKQVLSLGMLIQWNKPIFKAKFWNKLGNLEY